MSVELATAFLELSPMLTGLRSSVAGELGPITAGAARQGVDVGSGFGSRVGSILKGTLGAFGLGAVIGGVGVLAHEVIQATSDETAATARLDAAIRASGGSLDEYQARLAATRSHMEGMGYSAGQVDDALSRLVPQAKSPTAALSDLAIAANLARARNIDLTEAATIVGRVAAGNTGILARYGISLDVSGGTARQVTQAQATLSKAQQHLSALEDQLRTKTHLTAADHARLAAAQQAVADAQTKLTATTSAGGQALGALSRMFAGQGQAFAASAAGRLAALRAELADTFAKVGVAVAPAVQALVSAFAPALVAVVAVLAPLARTVAGVIRFGRLYWPELKVAAVLVGAALIGWKVYTLAVRAWTVAVTAAGVAQKAAAVAVTVFNAVMDAGPLLLVVGAIAALAAIAYVVYRNWSTISMFFVRLWHDITGAVASVVEFVRSHWQAAAALLLVLFTGPVGAVIALVFHFREQIVSFFESIPGALLGALEAVPQLLLQAVASVFDGLLNLLITWPLEAVAYLLVAGVDLITGLASGIAVAAPAVWNFFTALPGRILSFVIGTDTWLVRAGLNLLEGLAAGIGAAAAGVWAFFTALPGRVLGFVVGTDRWLLGAGVSVASGLAWGITTAAAGLWSWFTAAPGRIVGAVGYAGAWLIGAGMAIINGIRAGLEAVLPQIIAWLTDIAKHIGSAIWKGLGKLVSFLSPKTVAGVELGQQYAQAHINAVTANVYPVERHAPRAQPGKVHRHRTFHDQADIEMLLNEAAFLAAHR